MLPASVECSVLIAPSVFSNVYLNLSLFIEVPVSSQEVSSHLHVRGIHYGAVSVVSLLDRKSSDSVVFFFSFFTLLFLDQPTTEIKL